jgi:hypothetical protein
LQLEFNPKLNDGALCNVFLCIFNYWSSPPNRFPFFRNLSYPYLSITRYPNNPDSAESDPIAHLIITHTYSYYPPVRPFGVPFPLFQFPSITVQFRAISKLHRLRLGI